jgi:hypothetical protein
MFVWHAETIDSGNCSLLFRAFEMLELTIGQYSEAEDLDDRKDFEICHKMEELRKLLEEKMPKAWSGEEE